MSASAKRPIESQVRDTPRKEIATIWNVTSVFLRSQPVAMEVRKAKHLQKTEVSHDLSLPSLTA